MNRLLSELGENKSFCTWYLICWDFIRQIRTMQQKCMDIKTIGQTSMLCITNSLFDPNVCCQAWRSLKSFSHWTLTRTPSSSARSHTAQSPPTSARRGSSLRRRVWPPGRTRGLRCWCGIDRTVTKIDKLANWVPWTYSDWLAIWTDCGSPAWRQSAHVSSSHILGLF